MYGDVFGSGKARKKHTEIRQQIPRPVGMADTLQKDDL